MLGTAGPRGEPGRKEIIFGSDLLNGPLRDLISLYYIISFYYIAITLTIILKFFVTMTPYTYVKNLYIYYVLSMVPVKNMRCI